MSVAHVANKGHVDVPCVGLLPGAMLMSVDCIKLARPSPGQLGRAGPGGCGRVDPEH